MHELTPQLRVFWITMVIEPTQLDVSLAKETGLNVVLGGRAGDIFSTSSLGTQVGQSFSLACNEMIIPRVTDLGGNSQIGTYSFYQLSIECRQVLMFLFYIEGL